MCVRVMQIERDERDSARERQTTTREKPLCVRCNAGFPVVLGLSRRTHLGFSMTVSFVHLFLVFLCSFSSLSICVHAFLCVCVCVCVCPCVCVCACAACTLFGAFDPFMRKSPSDFPSRSSERERERERRVSERERERRVSEREPIERSTYILLVSMSR